MSDPTHQPWQEDRRRRTGRAELLIKVVAGLAILVTLGIVATVVLYVMAMSSYGSNK